MSTLTAKAIRVPKRRAERLSAAEPRPVRIKRPGASLGIDAVDTAALIRQIEEGLSFKAFERLGTHSGFSLTLLASIIGIPERTLARRKIQGRLSPEESERLIRVARIFDETLELFEGDLSSAARWLTSPKKALDNHQPIQYLRTELGAREVENLLGRLEYGVFS
jgi:putative toxin-antitoxin system antitoxin component (TIGR02293 family)